MHAKRAGESTFTVNDLFLSVFACFAKIHKSLRVKPAMQAGLTKRVMSIEDICMLADIETPKKRGSYKKKENI